MSDKYFTINLRAYLDKDEQTYVGEESLSDLLSDFSCPDNPDVEYFLLHNAIEFTKKRSIYHISCFSCEDSEFLLNFYTENHFKPFDIRTTVPTHGEEPRQLHQLLKFI